MLAMDSGLMGGNGREKVLTGDKRKKKLEDTKNGLLSNLAQGGNKEFMKYWQKKLAWVESELSKIEGKK